MKQYTNKVTANQLYVLAALCALTHSSIDIKGLKHLSEDQANELILKLKEKRNRQILGWYDNENSQPHQTELFSINNL